MGIELLIVNFHYIRDAPPERGTHHTTPLEFAKQLDAIHEDGFRFISLDALQNAIRDQDPDALGRRACLITFDDGLRESYEVGLPILDHKGIPGAMYVCSSTLSGDTVLDVHKFHHVQNHLTNADILQSLPGHVLAKLDAVPEDIIRSQYIWDDAETSRLKYLVNFLLTSGERVDVVQRLFALCTASERELAEELYMTPAQVRDLAARHALGCHGKTHRPLASLSDADLHVELMDARTALMTLTGATIDSISYPYGGASATSDAVIEAAAEHRFTSGLTMARGINSDADILTTPLRLKRFDTNDVYGGKSAAAYRRGAA